MSEQKQESDKKIVDWTIQIEESLINDTYTLAENNAQSTNEWVSINLNNAIISIQMSDLRASGVPPESEYQPTPTLAGDETPPAFLVPHGPIPALRRYHEVVPRQDYREEQTAPDDEMPPTIELLPNSNPGGYWTHIVAPGETLSGIAARYYGDSSQYPRIAQASNIYPPYIIYVGQSLTVPSRN